MKHLRNVLDGVAIVLESFTATNRSYIIDTGGFEKDSKALAKDARTFAADFKKQTDLVYEPLTTRSSKVK